MPAGGFYPLTPVAPRLPEFCYFGIQAVTWTLAGLGATVCYSSLAVGRVFDNRG
jgi:hypothetical protein